MEPSELLPAAMLTVWPWLPLVNPFWIAYGQPASRGSLAFGDEGQAVSSCVVNVPAVRLFAHRPPDVALTRQQDHKTYQIQLWDTEGLPFTIENPEPVRVVRSQEVLERQRYRRGERSAHCTDHEWLWITTLPQSEFPATVVRQLGHSRWESENNGWMDLTKHWALKHGFLYACQHRPKHADASSGQRRSVPNHGLAAVVWILLIAFTLSSAFVLRHSKIARLYHLSTLTVAAQLRAWTSKAPPSTRAPD